MEPGLEIAESPAPSSLRSDADSKAERMDAGRHSNIIGVHLVLCDDTSILLGRRLNTTFAQGQYHLPAGHLEAKPGESVTACAVREAAEELGITIDPTDLELAHVLHLHDLVDGRDRLGVFFTVRTWAGQIRAAEPHKCAGWEWHPIDRLPDPLVDYTRAALVAIRAGVPYSEMGWPVPDGGERVS
ncbi:MULTISPECIES: NUDIX hydrolase [unclassified Kitasatospora]|uniref:NUDIX hydrolase n=1 Tax=unclassified Kitasatospora TaxID=2633591 RepID=UPI0024747B04|nr:NUDIX domain-containing protein [Kitasatospora sp. MAP12-44]